MSHQSPKADPTEFLAHAAGSTSRRTVLKAGAVAAIGLGAVRYGVAAAQDATPAAVAPSTACVLTPEMTQGPYYVAEELVRQNITEGKAGVPVKLRIAVEDLASCGPLANAAVDIWHCDAQGYYSGITGENPGGGGAATGAENANTTFLRGVQITGADGVAEFDTIFPGWYAGRTVHVHMMVHVDGAAGDASTGAAAPATPAGGETYLGGHVSHTGQLFFTDDLANQIFATKAYARSSQTDRTENAGDGILGGHLDEPGFQVTTTPVNASAITDGITSTVTVTVDSTVTQASGGNQGGGGGQGGPPNGAPPANGAGGPPANVTPTASA